jgi:hypothetical protein
VDFIASPFKSKAIIQRKVILVLLTGKHVSGCCKNEMSPDIRLREIQMWRLEKPAPHV